MPNRALLAALLLFILTISAACVVGYLEFFTDQSTAATSPTRAAAGLAIPIDVDSKADDILASLSANYPDVAARAHQAVLVRSHDGIEMKRNGPGGKEPMPGAYSELVQWCKPGGGIGLWGIYEYWSSGSYVAVFRVRPLDGWDGNESCTLEIQSNNGNNRIASYIPKPGELKAGQWVNVPVAFTLGQRTKIEFRFWAGANGFAVDRIYLYRLP